MNNSYWDQFENHADDDYFNQFESHEEPKQRSKLQKTGRIASQFALGAAENALFPYSLASSTETSPSVRNFESRQRSFEEIEELGSKKRKGKITSEEENHLQSLISETANPLNTIGQFKEEPEGLRGIIGKATGLDLEPEGFLENVANIASFIKNPKKIIQESIKKGKLLPKSKEAKELLKFGREKGLTDTQLAPLIHPKRTSNLLGTAALRSKRAGKALAESENALGDVYSSLIEKGKNMPNASRGQQENLFKHFEEVSDRIKLSGAKTPDEKAAIEIIRELTNDFASNGIDPARIMATWQSINKAVNWNSIRGGKKILSKLKDPLEKLFTDLAPKEAKEFKMVNKLWGNLKDISSHIKPKQVSDMEKIATWGPWATGFYKLAISGNPKALGAIATAHGGRLLATEMLINPNLNGLMQKTLGNMIKGGKPLIKKAILDLKKGLEKYPEIYNEFKWDQLEADHSQSDSQQ